jgi:UDP-galactopyranose mutase
MLEWLERRYLMNILCLSHLRWDFVFQRPQHLLSRAAREGTVLYVEEPLTVDGPSHLEVRHSRDNVTVAVPHVTAGLSPTASMEAQRQLLSTIVDDLLGPEYVLWFYTPMALPLAAALVPQAIVYDCMDELSAFAGAPASLRQLEVELFRQSDVVFTGGQSLYEAKRARHRNVHAFPSSVDVAHFSRARTMTTDPADQANVPGVRLGFFGVIDERMDYGLIAGIAAQRPEWSIVLVGPTAKVNPETLPKAANIFYLGPKTYPELPSYIAGWDVAILPFARNEATRYISPTKTPEYLAAGRPVVSTSIRDVVRPYGQQGLARIADTVPEFVAAVEAAIADRPAERLRAADAFLTHMSWEGTWTRMRLLIERTIAGRQVRDTGDALTAS